jgi:putative flavoprotein involved in K+ transport
MGSMDLGDSPYDVAVVGAGQAGLAVGYFLSQQGKRFVILDAGDTVGSAWRSRWDSLRLFTSRRYDALPGMEFPGDPDSYPSRDEVIDYLASYAARFGLPLQLNTPVKSLKRADGRFVLDVGNRDIEADNVVIATGPFQAAALPPFAGSLAPDVFQIHSTGYRNTGEVPPGRVLVVGGGNTGYQIAAELSASHRVQLSVGTRQTPLPQRILGRDLFWWLTRLGLLEKTVDSRVGRRARGRDTLIGSSPRKLKRIGVELKPRVSSASGSTISFADGTTTTPDAVVWATGYRPDYSWIELPVIGESGAVDHRRGVTDVAGLYFVGLTWQNTRGSALLGWVKDDAEFIAAQIRGRRSDDVTARVPEAARAT